MNAPEPPAKHDFDEAFRDELRCLEKTPAVQPQPLKTSQVEPSLAFTDTDWTGIALSGGGIRSATFNLGLLQGLNERGLLQHFDYLATVSGGGYIGGWWTAWRNRNEKNTGFPDQSNRRAADGPEPQEVRHLRAFSRFLAPRWGFFEIETWQVLGSVVQVILPSLITAAAVLSVAVGVLLGYVLAGYVHPPDTFASLNALATVLMLLWLEEASHRQSKTGQPADPIGHGCALLAGVLTFAFGSWLGEHKPVVWDLAPFAPATQPAGAWTFALLTLTFVRTLVSRWIKTPQQGLSRGPLERVIARLVAFVCVWGIGFLLWAVTLFVLGKWGQMLAIPVAGGSTGFLFVLARQFLLPQTSTKAQTGSWRELAQFLTPKALAWLTLVLFAIVIALVILGVETHPNGLYGLYGVAFVTLLAVAVFFNPNEVGIHSFYRSRIVRAYLGASNGSSQATTELPDDDLLLSKLRPEKPFHLVCCAANDLACDRLETLSRGARSAVLSPRGFMVGDDWYPFVGNEPTVEGKPAVEPISLGTAMTASAAAVNSNMGSNSVRLGPAATFVAAALNLRLGYWVLPIRGDRSGKVLRAFPGLLFIAELLGLTRADHDSPAYHLSDGGHFENMAVYELLRRRCRFILAADCGQDPDTGFDDLGNALRRAREDFGVEVDIDVSALKAGADGLARQVIAVGDIHYADGLEGILLLFKPALTGGEPADVLQYKRRNQAFPQESTGDQFYDEAQWESYRRLGLAAVRRAFRFLDGPAPDVADFFGAVRHEWFPAPDDLRANVVARAADLVEMERAISASGLEEVLLGVYPEALGAAPSADYLQGRLPKDPQQAARTLSLLAQMLQLMENVFHTCALERHWNHPLNLGWLNCFGRWATAPVFRACWPILTPMYAPSFVRFVEKRFKLPGLKDRGTGTAVPATVSRGNPPGLARALWVGDSPPGTVQYSFDVELSNHQRIEVALAFVSRLEGANGQEIAAWAVPHFFVPPSLWGSGLGERFLDDLVMKLESEGFKTAQVLLPAVNSKIASERKRGADALQMYRQAGFAIVRTTPEGSVLERRLKVDATAIAGEDASPGTPAGRLAKATGPAG